ncbi:unnamed protein product, partial [Prorocentrum cordatum]
EVTTARLAEGFNMFKFDGMGGGLGQSGAGEFVADFEAMLLLITRLRRRSEALAEREDAGPGGRGGRRRSGASGST